MVQKINVSILVGKKIVKGILNFTIEGYEFISEFGEKNQEKLDWKLVEYSIGKIDIPVFLFVTTKKEFLMFEWEGKQSPQYLIEEIEKNVVIKLINSFKLELETECQKCETRKEKSQELEQKLGVDCLKQESEKLTCLIETERQEPVRLELKYDIDNPLIKELVCVARKYHYDFDEETNGIIVFNFLVGLILTDYPESYLDENSDVLGEIELLLTNSNVSDDAIREFEKIITTAIEYEEVDIQYLCDCLDRLYGEMNNVYHSDIRGEKKDNYDTKERIATEWLDVKREIREEEAYYRKVKYDKALEYIKKQKYPFKKEALKKDTGAPDGVIRYLFSNEKKIVNLYREYIWYDNLEISRSEEQLLLKTIKLILSDYKVHHIQELFENLNGSFSSLFGRIMVNTPYKLLGVLCVIPESESIYHIERPYIALKGTKITSAQERLEQYVKNKDRIAVSDILQYARDNYLHVQSIIELLNSLSKTHFFLNKYEMIKKSKINITYAMEKEIIKVFEKELKNHGGLMAICQMEFAHELPSIDYSWNEWLLYSIMRRGTKYPEVLLSSNFFSDTIPMVSDGQQYSQHEIGKIASECKNRQLKVADNMNNIDELLEDMIEDFIVDIEF